MGRTPVHGQCATREYAIWAGMLSRCRNPNRDGYANYGGRGVAVCERWNKFESFIADMGPAPSRRHSLDRIDGDGDYEPGNCRRATTVQQANNRKNTRMVSYRGRLMPLTEAVRLGGCVIHPQAAWRRIEACGWTVEAAIETRSRRPVPRTYKHPVDADGRVA